MFSVQIQVDDQDHSVTNFSTGACASIVEEMTPQLVHGGHAHRWPTWYFLFHILGGHLVDHMHKFCGAQLQLAQGFSAERYLVFADATQQQDWLSSCDCLFAQDA